MTTVALARQAMATRFEIILHGNNPLGLRAAGEEALDEIERLESQLSLYRPASEITRINAFAAREPVRVEPGLFRLLQLAQKLSQKTDGAFDITVGPLMRCWNFMGRKGSPPSPAELAEARRKVGMGWVRLDPEKSTVRFLRAGMFFDLGAIGKGYAIDRAAAILREAGVTSALLHGGTSSVCAIGCPPDSDTWKVAIEYPTRRETPFASLPLDSFQNDFLQMNTGSQVGVRRDFATGSESAEAAFLAVVPLRNETLSVSAIWGKYFEKEGRTLGHVMDPRTGEPASAAVLAAVVLPSATESDALSTALLTLGIGGMKLVAGLCPIMRSLVVEAVHGDSGAQVSSHGIELLRPKNS